MTTTAERPAATATSVRPAWFTDAVLAKGVTVAGQHYFFVLEREG